MKTHDPELLRIKNLLRNNPKGMKISRIARELAMNRNAAAKFLEILLMTGQVEMIEHGMSKIFILSRKTSIPTMLELSEDFILVLDKNLKISQSNDNYLKFTGMKREDLVGKRYDTIGLPVIGGQPVLSKIHEAYYGTDIRTEAREVLRGEEFFFDIRLTPTVFNDGTRGITIIIGDITQEKKNEKSLRESEANFRTLVEELLSCIDEAVILVDSRTAAISFVNPAAAKMFGYKQGEFFGKDPAQLLTFTGTIPGCQKDMNDNFRTRRYFQIESLLKRNSGDRFTASLQLRPIYDDTGMLRNIVMVIRDKTAEMYDTDGVSRSDCLNIQFPLSPQIGSADFDRLRPSL